MKLITLNGADCEAEGHPSSCQEPAPGSTVDNENQSVTINGTLVTTHGDFLHFPSHAHSYNSELGCYNYSSHDLVPDENVAITVNGDSVVRVGDGTDDPGSGSRADVIDSGGNGSITHTES